MRITNISFSRLLKLEIPQLAKGVLDIVEKHDPKSLFLKKAFDDFNLLKPEIESLIVRHGPHPLTERLDPLRKKRILYASSISFQVKGMIKGFIDGADDEVMVAKAAVNRYLLNLRANNEEIINERVDQFLNEITNDVELVTAMEALGLMERVDNLAFVNAELIDLLTTRNASISKRKKGVTPVSSSAIRNGLKVLFGRISAAT